MRKIMILTIFLLPFVTFSCSPQNTSWISHVESVHDGDTLTVNGQKIRLFGIDTPELNNQYAAFQPTTGIEQIYALQALKFTKKFTSAKELLITKETTDPYERVVAKINNGEDLGLKLLSAGLARVAFISLDKKSPFYTNDYKYYHKLLDAQYEAYNNSLGVWAQKELFSAIFPKAT